MEWELDRDAETVAKPSGQPTHGDLLGVLETLKHEFSEFRHCREDELREWMRWRNGVDTKVTNLSEAWGEQGAKAKETADQLAEIVRMARRIESMLVRRLYRDAAEGRDAEQDLRDLG